MVFPATSEPGIVSADSSALRHAAPTGRPGAGPLTVEWLTNAADIAPLAGDWRELESSVQDRTVLSTFDYNATWYGQYGAGESGGTLVGVARRGAALAGIAPLVIRRRRIGKVPLTCIEFAPHEAYAGEFLVEDGHPDLVDAFLDSLTRTTRFDVICLNGIEPGSDRFDALRAVAARRHLAIELTDHPNAVVDLREGYDKYFRSRTAHFRQAVRRQARRIEDTGPSSVGGVVLTRGLETLDDAVERMIAITEASHKLNGARLADCHRAFLTDLAHRFGPRGMLALPILRIGDRDAAFVFGLVERGCFYDVTLSYDEAFAHLRAGTHLIQEMLKALAAAGVRTVISHGAHEYKKHWASAFVPGPRVFLFAPRVRAAATRFLRFGLRPLWQRFGAPEP